MTQGLLPTPLNGCMGGIRNYTLAVNFFEIQDPEEYLKRNAKFHKWSQKCVEDRFRKSVQIDHR